MEGPKRRPLVALLALMEGPKPLLAPMEGPKQRKFWSDEMIKVLLDKCIEEMNSTGRNGASLHKQSWARLGRVFKEKFNIDFNQKDIKNGFDNLKAKYVGWLYLKNKTGNLYNPDTKMFNLTQEEWEDFKQVYVRLGRLRLCLRHRHLGHQHLGHRHLGHRHLGHRLLRGTCWSHSILTDDPVVVAVDDDDDDDDGNSRAHKIHDEVRPKKKAKTFCVTMDDLMVDMQSALRHIVGTTDGPTTEQCYEKLKLAGLRSTDPVFLAAFNIFGQSRQMREAWMTLPSEPDVLKGWIDLTDRQLRIFK
ncbi:Myb/SANT-like domain, harbinger transposase-derived nuclease domain protein [Tanacetum coccineum]